MHAETEGDATAKMAAMTWTSRMQACCTGIEYGFLKQVAGYLLFPRHVACTRAHACAMHFPRFKQCAALAEFYAEASISLNSQRLHNA